MEAEFYDYENNNKWRKIFRNMNQMSQVFSNSESRKFENRPLNRYMDVVPYDKTRVKLERYGLDYINASHVCMPSANRKYILTQGPLRNTSSHLWLMVWEQNSRAILMLNNLIEAGHIKCHQYWPEGDEDAIDFEDVNLRVELVLMNKYDHYTLRTFKLTDLMSKKSREILHFHYTSWPDFDLPTSCDSFLEFLYAVRQSESLDLQQYGPPVIHCSAGIGRSGTFVLVDSCLVMIENNKCRDSINVIDILLELRNYRMGLIQTSDQLRFSFLAILEGSKHIEAKETPSRSNSVNAKIQRSFGMNEEESESATSEDSPSPSNLPEQSCSPTRVEESETLRQRKEREEKRQKTLETISRIKRKQKEVEERLRFNQKLYKYFKTSFLCLGVAIFIGVVIIYRKRDPILINYE